MTNIKKYCLFIPQGGFNDCISNIKNVLNYCSKHNRILLLYKSPYYKINFSDYFNIPLPDIIYDSNKIIYIY